MSTDLSVQSIYPTQAVQAAAGNACSAAAATSAVGAATTASAGVPTPNPAYRLDASVGMVVIEFRNQAGDVTNSIPTQRQLEAYQHGGSTSDHAADAAGDTPPGLVA